MSENISAPATVMSDEADSAMEAGDIAGLPLANEPGLEPDFLIEVYAEKVKGEGEDSYLYIQGGDATLLATFDGCGGSGARGYERARGKTGAYLASRIASGAVRDWFHEGEAQGGDEAIALLKQRMSRYLAECRQALGGESLVRGTLAKELPTTCALLMLPHRGQDALAIWAGDSRCYLLDKGGLHQLTRDDVDSYDPMENLRADGVLTNVVSASSDFELHVRWIPVNGPCVALAATDGCFGYLSTPMEFERELLATLLESTNPADWERRLQKAFAEVAGDDATLCGVCVGFGKYDVLQDALAPRYHELCERYLHDIGDKDDDERRRLWEGYRKDYLC